MSERINERVEGYKPYSFMKDLKYIETYQGKYRIYSFNDSQGFHVFSPDINSIIGQRDDNGYKGADTVDIMVGDLKDLINDDIRFIKDEFGGSVYNFDLGRMIYV